MKKIAVLFLGLAMSVVSVGPSAAHAAGSATISLSPTNTSVETGEMFSLSVYVAPNGESLDTARVELDWDASKLEVLSFDLGSLFPYLSPSNEIDNTNGDLSYGAFKFGSPVTSSGTFGTVTFRALAAGSATISVTDDSRLISDGAEMINSASLGSSSITISGEEVASEAPEETTEVEEETSSGSSSGSSSQSLEEQALVYYGAFFGSLPSSDREWEALHCIAYGGCQGEPRNLDAEAAALSTYTAKYADIPQTSMEWNVVHTLAYTDLLDGDAGEEEVAEVVEEVVEEEVEEVVETPVEVPMVDDSMTLEEQGLVYFGAFYARMPQNSMDWEALHCIAYGGCQGDPRDLVAEENALILFGQKYAKMPETSMEWNVLHTIAYTDLLTYDQQGSDEMEEEVVEEEASIEELAEALLDSLVDLAEDVADAVAEDEELIADLEGSLDEVVEELSVQEQAIGWFGSLAGYLPSSDADWMAVDYMVNGYTPDMQDLEAEADAVSLFVDTFGYLPSSDQDWNIVAAVAYSGAF